jgi:Cd2+/Zn2+-exporting ATPase
MLDRKIGDAGEVVAQVGLGIEAAEVMKVDQRVRLDLPVLLPDVPSEADACVARLMRYLNVLQGLERVHLAPAVGQDPSKLCIHYNPELLSFAQVKEIAERAGARLTARFAHVLWGVEGLSHQRRARTVSEGLKRIPGVVEAEATAAGLLRIEFDREVTTEGDLRRVLAGMGVQVRDQKSRKTDEARGRDAPDHTDKKEEHEHTHATKEAANAHRDDE